MVKPGSIVGGFLIAISLAMQIITLVEIAQYWWLLFIWFSGLIAGSFFVAGGMDFGQNKMEYYTISGIGFGGIIALTVYFFLFQWDAIASTLLPLNEQWVIGAIVFSTASAILVAIATLFIAAGAGKQLKGLKPGAILGGLLISLSLALQIIVVIHIQKFYWLLVFWFVGLIGAIALAAGARAKGYGSTESFVIAGISIGILLVLVIWWTVSNQMITKMIQANNTAKTPPTHPFDTDKLTAIWGTVLSFIAGLVAFFGVSFSAASDSRRYY
ncbi:MAG: hypothetical protein GF308_19920 [Candidatus Heimdallarchaeota archaeon]|nr:hypothetical protein [Candidatus Heimdallarchaeota archaeon]